MKVAICDDLKEDRQTLKNALYQLEKEKNLEFDIHEYENPETLYKDCVARDDLKIIFFDIYMGDVLGTDAAKKMRQMGYKGSIIFCTTSLDHALDGFRVQADGYLVKPYSYEEFKEALLRLHDLFSNETKKISFVADRIEYNIPVSDVILIETSNKGCIVHTTQEDLFTWTKLKDFSGMEDYDCLYQVGRYYIVNLNAIEMVKAEKISLKNGMEITMPKRDVSKIKQDINDYVWNSMRK
ncbi:MAG: LytTR family DNA-binding domain-containing protein [Lachnospiraceae bacterium]|nr:LytTR family DNA-binding domain-containing protein [Lachnospiraceae bacterium]